jgi:hypothetical protein
MACNLFSDTLNQQAALENPEAVAEYAAPSAPVVKAML